MELILCHEEWGVGIGYVDQIEVDIGFVYEMGVEMELGLT